MSDHGFDDLRGFLAALRSRNDVVEIETEVDPRLEIAEIHRRIIAAGGPALLFRNVKGSPFPVVTNLFGTASRVELAFGREPQRFIEEVAKIPEELVPPTPGKLWAKRGFFAKFAKIGMKRTRRAPVLEVTRTPPRLSELPALTTWHEDGGPFVTLPLVYTEHPETGGHNLGMYRVQIHDDDHTGMHFQIGKGGGYHLGVAENAGQDLPLNVFIGGPPALILSAIAPLPENVPELLLASLVRGKRFRLGQAPGAELPLAADAEFVIQGHVLAGQRRPEGPFGDHYGYYSLKHDYPVLRVDALHHRRDAIYPATVVGKPRQEDFFIGDFLQELLSPLFPVVMPAVKDIWSYGETGYHSLAGAVVRDRYPREAMASAFRILGEGQLALTKFLIVTDGDVDLRDFPATLEHVLARCDLRTDLFVFANVSMDTLDYSGPAINEGSKGVILGLGEPIRDLARSVPSDLPGGVREASVYCGGCLVVDGPSHEEDAEFAQRVAESEALADFPLVVLVDDAEEATRSDPRFLWTTFTRFEPAADMFTRGERVVRHHRVFESPVVIDARKKASYPDELFCDPETAELVSRRWEEYFPAGQEMGDSDVAHLD